MTEFKIDSMKAEEFINDLEIKRTISWAEENKDNKEMLVEILKKLKHKRAFLMMKLIYS